MEITIGVIILAGILSTVASTAFAAGVSYMVLKFGIRQNSGRIDSHEERLDKIETKQETTGKDIVEIKTTINHMAEDMKEIKDCFKEWLKK